MDTTRALAALSALGHPMRLAVFRLLVQTGPDGLLAGEIADRLDVRQNTLSSNLALLTDAGLITRSRRGRTVQYAADMGGMKTLVQFLLEDCCGGDQSACDPALSFLTNPNLTNPKG